MDPQASPSLEKSTPRPAGVERPLTLAQLHRVLQMRLGFTVSENTLMRWCRECKIRAVRLGNAWRIPPEEVRRIVESAQRGIAF